MMKKMKVSFWIVASSSLEYYFGFLFIEAKCVFKNRGVCVCDGFYFSFQLLKGSVENMFCRMFGAKRSFPMPCRLLLRIYFRMGADEGSFLCFNSGYESLAKVHVIYIITNIYAKVKRIKKKCIKQNLKRILCKLRI